jgi:hypothetical protein
VHCGHPGVLGVPPSQQAELIITFTPPSYTRPSVPITFVPRQHPHLGQNSISNIITMTPMQSKNNKRFVSPDELRPPMKNFWSDLSNAIENNIRIQFKIMCLYSEVSA